MMDTVYVETTVVGHIAGRIHPNPDIAARQKKSRRWWATASQKYHLVISQTVVDECLAGDASAAQERLDLLVGIDRLAVTAESQLIASRLMAANAIPLSEPRDALHVAVAAENGIQYLVTWNFKHIANATLRSRINSVCRDFGFEPPTICTIEELEGETDDSHDAN
jgi:predicted nucleic acid-binding protein